MLNQVLKFFKKLKKESMLRSQLNMALSGMTPPASSSSSSCDAADNDLNTADVDLTYLEEAADELDQQQQPQITENQPSSQAESSVNTPSAAAAPKEEKSDSDEEQHSDEDDDLSSFDLNTLDEPVSAGEVVLTPSNPTNNIILGSSSDLEHVNDMYNKLLINNSNNAAMNVVSNITSNELVISESSSSSNSSSSVSTTTNINTNSNSGSHTNCLKRPLSDACLDDVLIENNLSLPGFKVKLKFYLTSFKVLKLLRS